MASFSELAAVLDIVDPSLLLFRLRLERCRGCPGRQLEALWRAYLASFVLNLPSTNALVRRLEDDSALRVLCGFSEKLPHRTTFNRFIQRLSHFPVLVEIALANLTEEIRELLPDFGRVLAVDSTTVRTHGNPNRKVLSDPEASWTAKNSPRSKGKDGKEWHYGYKVHAVCDADYGLPVGLITTTAKRNDSPWLPRVIEHSKAFLPWLKPGAVIADRGYDAESNSCYLYENGVAAIIHIRETRKSKGKGEVHSLDGRPICMGGQPMEFIETNIYKGHRYTCPAGGCDLRDSMSTGIRHCDFETWEHPSSNLRFFSWIPRHTKTWKDLYAKRQSIERMFKGMKQSRRLEGHCVRGLRQIRLHALMSTISFQATALVKIGTGQEADMRWMVRRVV